MHSLKANTLSATFLFCYIVTSLATQLDTVYQWRYFDYVWPSESDKQNAIKNGSYNYSQIIPMDVDVSQDGRVFVSLNYYNGTPARLAVVSNRFGYSGPLLEPYPDWDWHGDDCNAIIDPLRIQIDRCNRLWVIDGGREEPGGVVCPSKLLGFHLSNDLLFETVHIPYNISRNQTTRRTLLSNVRVETYGDQCENTTVYITDAMGYGLIVYDGKTLNRLESWAFETVPGLSNITSNSLNTNLSLGITGLDLLPKTVQEHQQYLYFRPSASLDLFAVKTEELKLARKGRPVRVLGVKNAISSQSIALIIASGGTMFLAPIQEHSIVCWNVYNNFNKKDIVTVAQDHERLQFVTGLRVVSNSSPSEEELWMISNRFQAFKYRILNYDEFNFHISKKSVRELIRGTKCEKSQRMNNSTNPARNIKDHHSRQPTPNYRG